MQSNFPDVLPTQQVAAEPVKNLPVLDFGQGMNNNVSPTTIRDTVYVDSSSCKKQVINQQTLKVRQPARVIYKTKIRTKSYIYVATPRDGKKVTLDSVLNDTTNWRVHRATCLSTSKSLRHFVRD